MSSKPSKVRKKLYNAPHHARRRNISATLSEDLRTKHGKRVLSVRKGDTVKIIRGEYSGIEGKVARVFPEQGRLAVEGVTREKIKGGTVPVRIHASKTMITTLNLDDKWRRDKLEGGS